jgi:phage regulator Rha-like protein
VKQKIPRFSVVRKGCQLLVNMRRGHYQKIPRFSAVRKGCQLLVNMRRGHYQKTNNEFRPKTV